MYLQLVGLQLHKKTESEIAAYFKYASAQEVFEELKGYGFPICEACGANPVVGGHCPKKSRAPSVQNKAQELPSIKDAETLFRDTIATLKAYLEDMTSLKETLRGGYFIDEGETDEENIREVRGAQWHPHRYEVVLIAATILEHDGNWWYVERLLKKLHPKPSEANRVQLVRFLHGRAVDDKGRPILDKNGRWKDEGDGLLYRAKQIATLIRGAAKVRTGPKPTSITPIDQFEAWHLRQLIEQGLSQEEIEKREREDFERSKLQTKESILEELEVAKQAKNETEFANELHQAHEHLHQLAEEPFDSEAFSRRLKLAWDLE